MQSLNALAAFGDELCDWLSEETPLPDAQKTLLLKMRDIGQEVAGALAADSASNCVKRLEDAANMLASLRAKPGELSRALPLWQKVIERGLAEARERQRVEEPIPQIYRADGKAIASTGSSDDAIPFKGRRALFRQLENALSGWGGERTTLLLYGQRRVGKTSALLQLPRRLGSQVVPAFLDLQDTRLSGAENNAGLLFGLADKVWDEARRHSGLRLPKLKREALAQDQFPAFGRWLDEVERTLGERTLLLCLDEFEVLEEGIRAGRFDTRILNMARNIAQHHRSIAVLLCGVHQIAELPPHWANALVTTSALHVSFLEGEDARELITRPVGDFPPEVYNPAAVDEIIRLTRCQPSLVQALCGLAVE